MAELRVNTYVSLSPQFLVKHMVVTIEYDPECSKMLLARLSQNPNATDLTNTVNFSKAAFMSGMHAVTKGPVFEVDGGWSSTPGNFYFTSDPTRMIKDLVIECQKLIKVQQVMEA